MARTIAIPTLIVNKMLTHIYKNSTNEINIVFILVQGTMIENRYI